MVVLRFKDPRPREFKVPLNLTIGGGGDLPIGLGLILFVLLASAVLNFLTKEVATVGGADLHGGVLRSCSPSPERYHAEKRAAASTSTSRSSTSETSPEVTGAEPGPDEVVPQAGVDPLDAEPVHAGEGAGRDRPGDDRASW